MTRLNRLIYYVVILFLFLFVTVTILPYYQPSSTTTPIQQPPYKQGTDIGATATRSKKYLSWLPHGDFLDQHEAFRNALRLSIELDRIVIAPMLRLGTPISWQPFEQLKREYEESDKSLLRQTCTDSANDPAACTTMNAWTEIPWSSLFDLKAISNEFNIDIVERTQGHGCGYNETAALEDNDTITDVVVVDVMSFAENKTFVTSSSSSSRGWVKLQPFAQRILQPQETQEDQESKLPLKTVIHATQWKALEDRQYVQFGALSSTPRYQVHATAPQMQFRQALNHHLLLSPNQMVPLTQQADSVIEALGGANHFSTLKLNLAKLIALDARVNKDVLGGLTTTMDDLDAQTQKELMDAVVLEIFGDIPINQAVSAAMPVQPDTTLAGVLSHHRQQPSIADTPDERLRLLHACTDYRENIEERYPIYYLINDDIPSPSAKPDVYGPLLSFFPCLFTKNDMKQWHNLDMSTWLSSIPELQDTGVDYEKLLDPMLDILIAGQGYSFFEVPNTPLTRFMSWQRRSTSGTLMDSLLSS